MIPTLATKRLLLKSRGIAPEASQAFGLRTVRLGHQDRSECRIYRPVLPFATSARVETERRRDEDAKKMPERGL